MDSDLDPAPPRDDKVKIKRGPTRTEGLKL
jgi:hypothetical protein